MRSPIRATALSRAAGLVVPAVAAMAVPASREAREHDCKNEPAAPGRGHGRGVSPRQEALPDLGSSISFGALPFDQSNMPSMEPAIASNEPWPMRRRRASCPR